MNPGSYAENVLRNQWRLFNEVPLKKGLTFWGIRYTKTNWHWDFIHQRFYYCQKIWKVIDGNWTVKDFKNLMENDREPYPIYFWGSSRWKLRFYGKYGRTKFIQHGVEKKEISFEEKRKRDWKKRRRDRQHRHPGYSGPTRYYKKSATRQHRNWQKQMMSHGQYDEMDNVNSQKSAKCFYDWW